MVEGARLESAYTAKNRIVGSNPTPSANYAFQRRPAPAGIDPIEARKAQQAQKHEKAARVVAFRAEAEEYINAHRSGWKNAKHGEQWRATLETFLDTSPPTRA